MHYPIDSGEPGEVIERDMYVIREVQLRERLRAMRHLPPGTPVLRPASRVQQQLLADLLSLSDDVDPLRWLQAERGEVAAQMALHIILEQAREMCRGISRLPPGVPVHDEYKRVLGDLLHLPLDVGPFRLLPDKGSAASAELLLSILRQMRTLRRVQRGASLSLRPRDEWLQLIADLLDGPEVRDPLRWLQDQRGAVTTFLTLSNVLGQCRPPQTFPMSGLPARKILHPRQCLRSSPGLRVVIEQVLFTENGFSIHMRVRLSTRRLSRPKGIGTIRLKWWGFERVVDDCGYHYLADIEELHVGPYLWWCREDITMSFYPAVFLEAKEITFKSQPIIIDVQAHSIHGSRLTHLPPTVLTGENMTWSVRAPS